MLRPASSYESKSGYVRDCWLDSVNHFRPYFTKMGEEFDFGFRLNHYFDDDTHTRDRRRIKPKDASLFHFCRRKIGQVIKASRFVEAHPIDQQADPWVADYARQRILREFNDPESNHYEVAEDVLTFAMFARSGCAEVAYDPRCGVVGGFIDPRRVTWAPHFSSPHFKRCPWLIKSARMTKDEIMSMRDGGWKVPDGIQPDSDHLTNGIPVADADIINFYSPNTGDSEQSRSLYTVLFYFERYNYETMKGRKKFRIDLKEDERFMLCENCGLKSSPQGALMQELPDAELCPQCNGVMIRQDAVEPQEIVEKYDMGKKLVITSPYMNEPFYDDRWPFPRMKGFPILSYSSYRSPVEVQGMSDTTLHRSNQLVIDSMFRLGYEQMQRAKGILIAPEGDLNDAFGNPWQFSDYQDVAYKTNPFSKIEWFQPEGLNPAWAQYLQFVQGSMQQNQGTGDVSFTPDQSKDVAYGTIRTIVEEGEIPVSKHIADFQRFWGRYGTRLFEAFVEIEGPAEVERVMGPEWGALYAKLRPQMVPGVDIILTAEPNISKEKADIAGQLIPLLENVTPVKLKMIGEVLGLPVSMTERYAPMLQAEQQAMMQQQAQLNAEASAAKNANGKPAPVAQGAAA